MTLILSGTDGLSDIDGSAATPAIRGTDANTGIFFPAADTIAFSEGGVESMRIDSSGNVGVGTSSPIGRADTVANGYSAYVARSASNGSNVTAMALRVVDSDATDFANAQYEAQSHQWITSGLERARIDSSGNLGIGTSSPGTRVHASIASGTAYATSSTGNVLTVANTTASGYAGIAFNTEPSAGNAGIAAINSFAPASGDSVLTFSTRSSSTLAERARITSGGDYVVGSASTVGSAGRIQAVQASSTGNAVISADAQSSSYAYNIAYLNTSTAAGTGFYFITCTSGNYGTFQFRVRGDGTIYAQNTTVQSVSDVRVKENIRDSEDGLQVVLGLQPRRFDFKQGFGNDRKNVLGFIAQEIETVFPDAVDITPVDPDNDGPEEPYKSVGPGALIPVLVKAIQEQQAIIQSLTARIEALEGK